MVASASDGSQCVLRTLCVGSALHQRLVPPQENTGPESGSVKSGACTDDDEHGSTNFFIYVIGGTFPRSVFFYTEVLCVHCRVSSTELPARDLHGPARPVRRACGAAWVCESRANACCVILLSFLSSSRRYARHASGLRIWALLYFRARFCASGVPRVHRERPTSIALRTRQPPSYPR